MNRRTLQWLAAAVVVLAVALYLVDRGGQSDTSQTGELLLPGLHDKLNDVTRIDVSRHGEDTVGIDRSDDGWVVPERGEFPADVGKIRDLLLAMADARTVEAKTANPELHSRLGLGSPDQDGSKGTLVSATADGQSYALIFGNKAQSGFRYARLPGADQAWLVDKDPEIPATIGAWLSPQVADIEAKRVRSVTISHPDGETLTLSKAAEDDTDFTVEDIPEGRELSYSTVGNGMGGALNDLELEDVRAAADETEDAVSTVFETFDGLTVDVRTVKDGDASWISLHASGGPDDEADVLNARVDGRQFKVADYKANLLTRRWDDILKAPPADKK